jgi:hypothetical protein
MHKRVLVVKADLAHGTLRPPDRSLVQGTDLLRAHLTVLGAVELGDFIKTL